MFVKDKILTVKKNVNEGNIKLISNNYITVKKKVNKLDTKTVSFADDNQEEVVNEIGLNKIVNNHDNNVNSNITIKNKSYLNKEKKNETLFNDL